MDDAVHATRPRLSPLKVVALGLVVFGLALDLWSKSWMQHRLGMDPSVPHQSEQIEVIPGFFRFEGNWNTGITFGLAAGYTEPILVFTAVACVGILVALVLTKSRSKLLHVALALILGGAIGNLHDRWQWHKVRDFLVVYWKDPSVWQWPAFNVADSIIVIGVALILWRELFGRRAEADAGKAT
jgi:signal peptidase II